MPDTIRFTVDKLEELKQLYDKAHEDGIDVFMFEGCEVSTAYAKYLIKYVELKLDAIGRQQTS